MHIYIYRVVCAQNNLTKQADWTKPLAAMEADREAYNIAHASAAISKTDLAPKVRFARVCVLAWLALCSLALCMLRLPERFVDALSVSVVME